MPKIKKNISHLLQEAVEMLTKELEEAEANLMSSEETFRAAQEAKDQAEGTVRALKRELDTINTTWKAIENGDYIQIKGIREINE